jgi:hypothetical protein
MVQLVKNSKIYGVLVAALLWLFGPIISHWTHDDETPDEDVAPAIQEKQLTQIAPPSDFQPMRSDPWPWFDDDSGVLAQQMAQQVNKRLQSNFLIVVNGAHRQAMNEFEAATS